MFGQGQGFHMELGNFSTFSIYFNNFGVILPLVCELVGYNEAYIEGNNICYCD